MKSVKIMAAILITIAGLAGSYLIINPFQKDSVSDLASQTETNNKDNKNLDNGEFNQDIISTQFEEETPELNEENVLSDNLTEKFTASVFERIEPSEISDKNDAIKLFSELKSENLLNDIFKNTQSDFNLISDIEEGGIKISQDNSREAKIQYLKAIEEITEKDFGDFRKNYTEVILDSFQKLDSFSASRLAGIYKNLAGDYLRLSVPPDFADIHKRTIIYFKNAEIVYKAMSEYQDDPVKGYLALEMIDKLVAEIEQIQIVLEEKVKKI